MLASTQLSLALVTLFALPGCFIFVDEDLDDDYEPVVEFVNSAPEIVESESWWMCDYDAAANAYFFEFEAFVDDYDGYWDVEYVDVTVNDVVTGETLDGFGLIHEQDGVWGGLIWEDESNLFCGEAVDVIIEAWDSEDAYDRVMIRY